MSDGTDESSQARDELVEEHEAQTNELMQDVKDPADVGDDDGFSMELAGLELGRRDFMNAGAATGS